MLVNLFFILSFIPSFSFANAVLSIASPALCSSIFNQGIQERDLESIDILIEENPKALATYLTHVDFFSSFSKEELLFIARRLQSEAKEGRPIDEVLSDITENSKIFRNQVKTEVLRQRLLAESKEGDFKPKEEEEPPLPSNEIPIPEKVVNVGNIGDAKIAKGSSRFMVLRPWSQQQLQPLELQVTNLKIQIVAKNEQGLLVLLNPIQLAKVAKDPTYLQEVLPFKGVAKNF